MPTPTKYSFGSAMDIPSLVQQIVASAIVTVLDHIDVTGSETDVWFKDVLSSDDETALSAVVAAYVYVAPAPPPPLSVQTQFETANKTIKLACGEGDVGSDSTATILVVVPGTPGSGDGRWLNSGEAFFDVATAGDKILGVWFVDHDNIMGGGVDTVVGSYTDDAAPTDNQGWYLPPVRGTVKAETIGYYGFAPSGFYIKIVAKKANSITTGKFYVNLEWAVQS